jgi:regulator of cell morphogenesis and NO signaling
MTVREIALQMPQTTRVFEEFKIDYCCGGRRPLAEACEKVGPDTDAVMTKLNDLFAAGAAAADWIGNATLPELMDHIVDKHHVFTKNELENLEPLTDKVVRVHGEIHPEIAEMKAVFEELSAELFPHMMKEETVLFPYVDRLARNKASGILSPMAPFGSVAHPVRMMMLEHEGAGDLLSKLRRLSGDYTPPPDACPSFSGLYSRLAELERDLHEHIHLENNVLFPKAIEMEESAFSIAAV